jgi:mono/diheme cytochrome c family protein
MNLSPEKRAFACAILAATFSVGSAWLLTSPIQTMTSSPPSPRSAILASSALPAQGREFFAQSCSDCHGEDAHGDEGPDLHNLSISNARIAAQIRNGAKGEMPSFAKKYDAQQVAALVSYVRSLR